MSCNKTSQMNFVFLSLRLEVLLEDVVGGSLLAPVPDDTRGALKHLPSHALPVQLTESSPLAQLHVAVHLDKGDAVLHAEGGDELLVLGLVTVLGEDAEQRLPLVQGLLGLPEAAGEAVSDQRLLEDLLEGRVNVHGAGISGGGGWNISFNIAHVEILNVP